MLPDWVLESELLAGGWVIAAIVAASVLMWILILDRYLYLWRRKAKERDALLAYWRAHRSSDARVNRRLRAGLTSSYNGKLIAFLPTIQVITAILPLLGLLGTVSGMIKTFEVMTVFGSGNVRGMAEGISQALITTMAGLLTALAGMYFAGDLQGRVRNETEQLSEVLSLESSIKGVDT